MNSKVYLYLSFIIIIIALFIHNSNNKHTVQKKSINTFQMEKQNKININSANIDDLIMIPGIGESLAKKIIDYRKSNGNFKDIEELMNIKGIKEKKLKSIKKYICIN